MTASWHIYFATIAQSAAALMGLLFVAASIHLDKIMSERILLRVFPRQSPSSAILFEISCDADPASLAPGFVM